MANEKIRPINLENLGTLVNEIKSRYATKTALEGATDRIKALEDVGAQANVLEGVKVNGTALAIANKMVDVLIATGTADGSIKVNGTDVSVAGLAALAYKQRSVITTSLPRSRLRLTRRPSRLPSTRSLAT